MSDRKQPASKKGYPQQPPVAAGEQAWWDGLDATERDEWAPFLRVLTPDERREFHSDRRYYATRFTSSQAEDRGPFGGAALVEREHYRHLLRSRWAQRLGSRLVRAA